MAEYINKPILLSGLNLRLLRLKNEQENVDKIAELENIIGAISETETTDVVERSKIDKAIEKIKLFNPHLEHDISCSMYEDAKALFLAILERNIGE